MDSISDGVMKVDEHDDAVWYRVKCDCGLKQHSADVYMEVESGQLSVSIDAYIFNSCVCFNKIKNLWNNICWRIGSAMKILFTGWIEGEGSILIDGGEHLDNFIGALEVGKKRLNAFRVNHILDSDEKYLQKRDLDLCSEKTKKLVMEAWENGEDVPKYVVLVGERELTEAEIKRGIELEPLARKYLSVE